MAKQSAVSKITDGIKRHCPSMNPLEAYHTARAVIRANRTRETNARRHAMNSLLRHTPLAAWFVFSPQGCATAIQVRFGAEVIHEFPIK